MAAAAPEHEPVGLHALDRVEQPDRPDRGQRRDGDRTADGDEHRADDGDSAPCSRRCRGRKAAGTHRPQCRRIGRRPSQQLRKALGHERQQGDDGQAAKYRERDRLRLNGLLRFVLHDGQPADREDEREIVLVRGGLSERPEPPGKRSNAGVAIPQPQGGPAERPVAARQVPSGRRRRQDRRLDGVEVIDQGR